MIKKRRRQRCSHCRELVWNRFLCVQCGRRFCRKCALQPHCEKCYAPCALAGKKAKVAS